MYDPIGKSIAKQTRLSFERKDLPFQNIEYAQAPSAIAATWRNTFNRPDETMQNKDQTNSLSQQSLHCLITFVSSRANLLGKGHVHSPGDQFSRRSSTNFTLQKQNGKYFQTIRIKPNGFNIPSVSFSYSAIEWQDKKIRKNIMWYCIRPRIPFDWMIVLQHMKRLHCGHCGGVSEHGMRCFPLQWTTKANEMTAPTWPLPLCARETFRFRWISHVILFISPRFVVFVWPFYCPEVQCRWRHSQTQPKHSNCTDSDAIVYLTCMNYSFSQRQPDALPLIAFCSATINARRSRKRRDRAIPDGEWMHKIISRVRSNGVRSSIVFLPLPFYCVIKHFLFQWASAVWAKT